MKDVSIVTCIDLPEPDHDEAPLMAALSDAGIDARLVAWNDPAVDWSQSPLTVIRSAWDYMMFYDRFLEWVDHAAARTRLLNPAPIVKRNAHKSYLLDLERAGVPVTPTELVTAGENRPLSDILDARGWDDIVIKPAVSAGSWDTLRVRGDSDEGQAWLSRLTVDRDALIQPYLTSVDDYGERALVWIDGELTHSVRKTPRWHDGEESVSTALPLSDAEAALAARALATVEDDLLYGRVDVAPGPDGDLVVMELELIEPSLFLVQHPPALERLVTAIRSR